MAHPHTTSTGALATPPSAPVKNRFLGVDVTRGIALLAMLATNVWEVIGEDGRLTLTGMTATGRAATVFVMVAGISLAFISGGRRPVRGTARRAARANIAVRAVLIGALGLALGYVSPESVGMILTYYGLFFLLAIPLIGLRPRTLVGIAAALVVVAPLVLMAAHNLGLEDQSETLPTLTSPFTDPVDLLLLVVVTGEFPAVTYMAYICVGLAVGRLDLSSPRVAVRLLVGGLALAIAAWTVSWLLVFRLGGLQALLAASEPGTTPTELIWDGDGMDSWWWLALRVHHSGTPLDMLGTLGSALAVLGAVLLVCRLRVAQRLLRPVALAGAMTLTVYSAQAVVLAFVSTENLLALWLGLVAGALLFAVLWNRWMGQGPLERLVAIPADRARRAVLARDQAPSGPRGPGAPRERT
jgi:uncharacterized membrane protein YeiB